MIKLFQTIFLFIFSFTIFAELVTTEVNPPEPIVNESFYVTFKVKSSGDSEPYITFTPSGLQVLGKREQGVSIQTVVINGKFTSTKEQNIVYELIADKPGIAFLRNIKVEISGKSNPVKDVQLNVLSTPKKIPEAFMEAQVSKTKVYVGEGIDVNYYLYFKSSIAANDVKDFPKLNKFIKRFHHINSPVETVQYKNEVLKRILAYSARIYPEKAGTALIDPMRISVQVVESDYNGFGFGTQRVKTKELSSNRIEIEVAPLPTEGVPVGFTGLVGEHEFNLTAGKSKYLVNEPIELKLEVSGKGALEKMDAPTLYADNNLENFDTKADVKETSNNSAKKIFEYTYLARNALSIASKTISIAYFDPSTGKYVDKKLELPGIEVSGTATATTNNNKDQKLNNESDNRPTTLDSAFANWFGSGGGNAGEKGKQQKNIELGLVGPIYSSGSFFANRFIQVLNLILLIILILIFVLYFKSLSKEDVDEKIQNKEVKKLIKVLKSKGLDYSTLYQLLSFLDSKNLMSNGGVSLYEVIEGSQLSIECKVYFKNSLELCEKTIYSTNKNTDKVKYESKYFSELVKFL